MEAAVANFFSAGDKIITIEGGKFGERWTEIGKAYKLNVIPFATPWGQPLDLAAFKKILSEHPDAKGVFATLTETSTASVYDIKEIGTLVKERAQTILIVDAISGLGQDMFLGDQWGVDAAICGSQKGFMLPPGLAFISVSPKAVKCLDQANLPRYYWNLKKAYASYQKDDTPFTPAVSLIRGLAVSLELIKAEGIEKRWERYAKMAFSLRTAFAAIGLKPYSQSPSNSVTAISCPIDTNLLLKKLRKENGLSIAEGQGELKGKIFRVAHMGCINEQDILKGLSLIEMALRATGYTNFKSGDSLKKFQEAFYG
jgi:aspartate aminotransferase-like enzyme